MKHVKKLWLFVLLAAIGIDCPAENAPSPIDRPINQEILGHYRRKSDEYVSRNLNRFALEKLQVYDRLLDSLYTREKEDTLNAIESNYKAGSSNQASVIKTLKDDIAVQSTEKETLNEKLNTLIKYAGIAFAVWLALVILFIRYRRSRMKKTEHNFATSETQLGSLEDYSDKAKRLFNEFSEKREQINKLEEEIVRLENSYSKRYGNEPENETYKAAIIRIEKLKKTVEAEKRIVESILSQSAKDDEERITVDINSICDAYMEIAFRGLEKTETFNCQVSRDFEKKLPGVQMNPSAVGTLLLNVLSNAFESVKEKNELGIKGYQPKVSISTRILPKFLQVRIKDNGTGMSEQMLQSAGTEFFSTRTISPRPGLGLSIARSIVEQHKGEIKIESEEGNSTDVYIKFYLK